MPEISIRPAVSSDLEALVELQTRAMHFPMGHRVREWFREDYPGGHRPRFAVAEDKGRLVAAAALLPCPFAYRGVPLEGAFWDAVATDEAYRRRGLCRRLFDALTPSTGPDALFVWGLTWLYRRFGYTPALRNFGGLDSAKRTVRAASLSPSPLQVRPATPEDVAFLVHHRARAGARYVVSSPADEERWRYDLRADRTVAGPGETGLNRWQEWRVLERRGRPVGYFMHDPWDLACLMELEIASGETTWREAGAAAIRSVAEFASKDEVTATLPDGHPIFGAFPHAFGPRARPYGDIAVRLPDSAAFLRKIGPALEQTLARSALAGWTGEIGLSRVDDGLRVRFEQGLLSEVAHWSVDRADSAGVRLMPGRFEALVFGYRSVAAILDEDPDCAADEEAEAFLAALFPPGDSYLRPI